MKTLTELKEKVQDERTLGKNMEVLERYTDTFEEVCDKSSDKLGMVVGPYDYILYYMRTNNEILRQILRRLEDKQ